MADNQKMWADLGMNLEMHDMLCEVLPGAIGDVFMSQENRPAAMDYFDMVLADVHGLRPSELVEFRKNGGKVFGTFCAYVPDEVIFAAELIGLEVFAAGQQIGKIKEVLDYPGNSVYVVKGKYEYMIPAVKEFILSTDMEKNEMQVKLIEGMRSDED